MAALGTARGISRVERTPPGEIGRTVPASLIQARQPAPPFAARSKTPHSAQRLNPPPGPRRNRSNPRSCSRQPRNGHAHAVPVAWHARCLRQNRRKTGGRQQDLRWSTRVMRFSKSSGTAGTAAASAPSDQLTGESRSEARGVDVPCHAHCDESEPPGSHSASHRRRFL